MAKIVAVDTFLATGLVFRYAGFAERDVVAIGSGRHLIFL
jgi:putative salt-induced outer membrane protein YdiY